MIDFFSKLSPLYVQYGNLLLVVVFLSSFLGFSIILALFAWANKKYKEAEYVYSMSQRSTNINPLDTLFKDKVIRIEDLRMPGKQLHEDKIFERCKFVGTGGMVIVGGKWAYNLISECGDMLPIPENSIINGLPVLKNCTVKNCEFYYITLLSSRGFIEKFQETSLIPS